MAKKKINISGVSLDVAETIKKEIIESEKEIKERLLTGKKIGISISDSEDIKSLGFSNAHQNDAIIEFVRHILILDGQIVYGGDLRNNGFTFLFSELAYQYRDKSNSKKDHLVNFSSYPTYLKINRTQELEFKKNRVKLRKIEPPKSIKSTSTDFFKPDSLENQICWAESLTKMRTEMIDYSDFCIFLGGRSTKFSGKIPGLLEEVLIAFRTSKPIYLIGAFGGITKAIIDALGGENPEQITESFQRKEQKYSDFLDNYLLAQGIDYSKIIEELNGMGIKSLSNGLSDEENSILFNTIHIPEMIFYVLKGLKKIYKIDRS
jgi:hypothetical protein